MCSASRRLSPCNSLYRLRCLEKDVPHVVAVRMANLVHLPERPLITSIVEIRNDGVPRPHHCLVVRRSKNEYAAPASADVMRRPVPGRQPAFAEMAIIDRSEHFPDEFVGTFLAAHVALHVNAEADVSPCLCR